MMESLAKSNVKSIIRQKSGQILLEYVLLIFIAVAAATLLTRGLVSRSTDSPGVVILKWTELVQLVGEDIGD